MRRSPLLWGQTLVQTNKNLPNLYIYQKYTIFWHINLLYFVTVKGESPNDPLCLHRSIAGNIAEYLLPY